LFGVKRLVYLDPRKVVEKKNLVEIVNDRTPALTSIERLCELEEGKEYLEIQLMPPFSGVSKAGS
jgi:hypothetical protein